MIPCFVVAFFTRFPHLLGCLISIQNPHEPAGSPCIPPYHGRNGTPQLLQGFALLFLCFQLSKIDFPTICTTPYTCTRWKTSDNKSTKYILRHVVNISNALISMLMLGLVCCVQLHFLFLLFAKDIVWQEDFCLLAESVTMLNVQEQQYGMGVCVFGWLY